MNLCENMKRQQTPSGPVMYRRLKKAGIPVQKVVRRMDTGDYIAEAYHPGMEQPVESSFSIASQIQAMIDGVRVISCNDKIAEWRDGQPVIWASVTFKWTPNGLH